MPGRARRRVESHDGPGAMTEVSILMPLRDGARWLAECLDSIAAQTFRDYELLVVDDHSRDGGPEIVAARARRDARIRLLPNPARGLVSALNHGLQRARGGLVARMDADDRMHPSRIAAQVQALAARPCLALLGSRVDAFPAASLTDGMRDYLRWQDRSEAPAEIAARIYLEAPFVHPSVMFRRDVVRALGGYRDVGFAEDYDLWLRLARAGHPMARLPHALLDWRQHPHSLSRTDPRYARDAFDRLRAHYLADDPRLHTPRPIVVWGAGRRTRQRACRLQQRGIGFAAYVDIDPHKVGNRVRGVPVHPPSWLAAQRGAPAPPFVLVYVASHGAREAIAAELESMRYREGADYLQVG